MALACQPHAQYFIKRFLNPERLERLVKPTASKTDHILARQQLFGTEYVPEHMMRLARSRPGAPELRMGLLRAFESSSILAAGLLWGGFKLVDFAGLGETIGMLGDLLQNPAYSEYADLAHPLARTLGLSSDGGSLPSLTQLMAKQIDVVWRSGSDTPFAEMRDISPSSAIGAALLDADARFGQDSDANALIESYFVTGRLPDSFGAELEDLGRLSVWLAELAGVGAFGGTGQHLRGALRLEELKRYVLQLRERGEVAVAETLSLVYREKLALGTELGGGLGLALDALESQLLENGAAEFIRGVAQTKGRATRARLRKSPRGFSWGAGDE